MTDEELLHPKRHFADRTSWEPKAGAFASIQRALAGRRRYSLAQANEVSAQVVQLEPGFCFVRLEADVRQQRAKRITGATVMAVVGWGMTGAVALIAPPLAVAQALMLVPAVGLTAGGADGGRRDGRAPLPWRKRAPAARTRAGPRPARARRHSLVQPGHLAGGVADLRPHRLRSTQSLRDSSPREAQNQELRNWRTSSASECSAA